MRRDAIRVDISTPAPDRDEPLLFRSRPSCRTIVVVQFPKTCVGNVGAPGFQIMETSISSIDPAFLVVASRVRTQKDSTVLESRGEVAEYLGELTGRYMKERGVGENPVESGERQIKPEKVLMQHLTIRFGAGDSDQLA